MRLLLVLLLGGGVKIVGNFIKGEFNFNLEPFFSKVGLRCHVSDLFANSISLQSLQMLSSLLSATTPPNFKR